MRKVRRSSTWVLVQHLGASHTPAICFWWARCSSKETNGGTSPASMTSLRRFVSWPLHITGRSSISLPLLQRHSICRRHFRNTSENDRLLKQTVGHGQRKGRRLDPADIPPSFRGFALSIGWAIPERYFTFLSCFKRVSVPGVPQPEVVTFPRRRRSRRLP